MTTSLHGRLGRLVSTRVPLLMLPLLFLAACAIPPAPPHAGEAPADVAGTPAAAAMPPAAAVIVTTPAAPAAAAEPATPPPAPTPVDPLRPEQRLNLDDRAAQTDLWERVREGFAMPDLDNDLVHSSEQWYASRPDYVQRMTERGGRYLYYIVEELDRRGMPTELALLPFIESAYNPQAMSTARASGMWQFVPATGKDYSLKQNIFRDDRRDVLASTRAALDHLQRLYAIFGDWQLTLAAYNWGEGSVQRAVARNQKLGLGTDYASLKMPNETQAYVPKLQAVKNIVLHPADFGLTLPPLRNHPYFLSVPIERDMDVAVAVKLARMPLEEFQSLNPQMNKPVILAAGTPQVLLPYDNANEFVRRLPQHRGPLASWTAWVAPKTLRPADAAREVGMTEAELREVNRIPPRMLVKAGSTLLVPRTDRRVEDVSVEIADNAMMALAPDVPPVRKVVLRAGRRDSVAAIARRYRLAPAQVAQWNGVSAGATLRPGQAVVVFLPLKQAQHLAPAHAERYARGSKPTPVVRVHAVVTREASTRKVVPAGPPSTRSAVVKHKSHLRLARD